MGSGISASQHDDMNAVMTAMTFRLELYSEGSFTVDFRPDDMNEHPKNRTQAAQRLVTLDRQTWEELGSPREITIKIKGGDTLNG